MDSFEQKKQQQKTLLTLGSNKVDKEFCLQYFEIIADRYIVSSFQNFHSKQCSKTAADTVMDYSNMIQ